MIFKTTEVKKLEREENRNREKVIQIGKKNQVQRFQSNHTDIILNMN